MTHDLSTKHGDRSEVPVSPTGVERKHVVGIPADGYSTVGLISAMVEHSSRSPASVATYVNVHVHNVARRMQALRSFLERSDICYVDGAGIALGARLRGVDLPARTTAADFFPKFLQTAVARELRIFFLAGKPGVAAKAAERLGADVPGFHPVGVLDGYFDDNELVIEQINQASPDVLIVGLGTPRQEMWIEANRDRLDVGLIWAVGALLDFAATEESRCPPWMGANGLEWLYRLLLRPRERARRYLLGNPAFLLSILEDWIGSLAVGSVSGGTRQSGPEPKSVELPDESFLASDTPTRQAKSHVRPQHVSR